MSHTARHRIGHARPWEPPELLVLCWAGAVAGDRQRGEALAEMRDRVALIPDPWQRRRERKEEARDA